MPREQVKGYHKMLDELGRDLCEITGYDKISFQPNSGAQGEYAGLRTIMKYLKANGQGDRRVRCFCILEDLNRNIEHLFFL